jgi:hypothetical protein
LSTQAAAPPANYATPWRGGLPATRLPPLEPWDDAPGNWQDEPDVGPSQAAATMRRHGYSHAANRPASSPSHPAEPYPSVPGRTSTAPSSSGSSAPSSPRASVGSGLRGALQSFKSPSAGDGAGSFLLGAILAANVMAYLEYGSAGVKSWWSAKFWNKPNPSLGAAVPLGGGTVKAAATRGTGVPNRSVVEA